MATVELDLVVVFVLVGSLFKLNPSVVAGFELTISVVLRVI